MANTVTDAMILCSITDQTLFDGLTQVERITNEVFDDHFTLCMDKSIMKLEDDFKSYSAVTLAQGQIRLNPGIKKNIKAFIQWCRDLIRVGRNPEDEVFPVPDAQDLIRHYKTHEAFITKSKMITEMAKPKNFTDKVKQEEWKPLFTNFLQAIPGRNGIPLSYIVRDNENGIIVPDAEFIDDYVNHAPLNGDAFNTDAAEVSIYIATFIAGNEITESC